MNNSEPTLASRVAELQATTSNASTTSDGADSLLTTVTSLVSRGGHEEFVAREFERVFLENEQSTHHLATLLIQQENGLSFLISQFRGHAALQEWRRSQEYRRMVETFGEHSLRELCMIESPVARITVPSDASGPKWKVLVSTWIVTFPLLLVIVQLLTLLAPHSPMFGRVALASLAMSVAIIWFINPAILRLTRTWRLKSQQMKLVMVAPRA